MNIRTFQPGDEDIQVALYNEAAGQMPAIKPAGVHEILRRTTSRDFDPNSRFFACEGNQVIGYCSYHANGRISYPWFCKGFEQHGAELFQTVLHAMKSKGIPLAFAAYRQDWQPVLDFFEEQGFHKARDMVNFSQDVLDMPTVPLRSSSPITAIKREDVPLILQLAPQALRVQSAELLEEHLFQNPYFKSDNLFVLRSKLDESPIGVGILITETTYADVTALDPLVPCFRLGAFGTEFMQTKRIKGLFSILIKNDGNLNSNALDLLGQAFYRLQDFDDIGTLAAQVGSDTPHLLQFYQRNFRRQGSFPVYERSFE